MSLLESVPSLPARMTVTFRSAAFNTSVPDRHFISSRSYGGDVASWLINELTRRDARAQPMIGQQNAGWLVRFRFYGVEYDFLIRYQSPDWAGLLERRQGIVARFFKRPRRRVEFEALSLIDTVLASSGLVSDICWHCDEDQDD